MKTLICLELLPLYTTRASPSKDRNPFLYPKSHGNTSLPIKSWKLHSQAKGFGGPAVTDSETKTGQNKNTRSTRNGDGGDEDDDEIPQSVFHRLIVRILFYAGTPMAIGVSLLLLFGTLKDQHVWDVPLWLPALTTLLTFGMSVLGIPYGALSTSWDPEKKGSLFGWEMAQQNWPELWREEDQSK